MGDKPKSQAVTMTAREKLHATVFCQCFSPCGKFLVTADNYGHMSLFNIPASLGPDANDQNRRPVFRFKAHEGSIYSLVSTDTHLISAGTGDIQAWSWSDITSKSPRVVWSLPIKSQSRFGEPEVNSMVINHQEGGTQLVAGCGDNVVHTFDLESGTQLAGFTGHTDYIHQVALRSNGAQVVSASEDGTARIWDTRSRSEVHRLEPFKNEKCVRPHLGKWLGCVAVDTVDDWMVCGGGPHLSMWHLRSLNCTSVFHTERSAHQHVMFYDDSVISGGSSPYVYHWAVNGVEKSRVPCTPTSVFNIAINTKDESTKVLSVAGNCAEVDVCTNFGYKAFSLKVF